MSVLILENNPLEGPGTIGDFLRGNRVPFTVIDLQKELIPDPGRFSVLVMLGGPMSVNEEDLYPHITKEMELVREFISSGRKVFGVCLGAQIMAKALGAKVYAGSQKEIGWYEIELVDAGVEDLLMRSLASHPVTGDFSKKFSVLQWHGETYDIPAGAVRLAGSELYPNQAFRYGDGAYAFQFHIEARKEMIYGWLKDEPVDMERIRKVTAAVFDGYLARTMSFYKKFFGH